MPNTYPALQKRYIRMSPEDYLKKREKEPSSIRWAAIIPPSMTDEDDYGSFMVELASPTYEVDL